MVFLSIPGQLVQRLLAVSSPRWPGLPEHRRGLRPVPKGTSSTPQTHHLEEFLQPSEVTDAYYLGSTDASTDPARRATWLVNGPGDTNTATD